MSCPCPSLRHIAALKWPWLALILLAGAAAADPTPSIPIKNGVSYTARESAQIGGSTTVPIENESSPDGKTVQATVIIFDAQPASSPGDLAAPGFIGPIPSLRDGSPAELRIYNPNSYLNSYTLSCAGIDYHTSPPPAGLGGLLLSTRGTRGATSVAPPTAPDALTEYNNFILAYNNEMSDSAGLKTCLNTIVQAITVPQATNASIRVAAVPAVASLLGILSPPAPTNNATLLQNGSPALMVTDFTSDQEPQLQQLLTGVKNHDISKITADSATVALWYKAWATDYPKFANDPGASAENNEVQLDEADAAAVGDGSAALDNIIAIFTEACDFEATPTYYVDRVNQVSGVDEETFTVSVGAKPPTSKFAQVNVDNTSIGLSGAASQTYVAQANVYGRVVLDFSAGVATSTLHSHNYYSSGTTHIVHQGASDSAQFAVGALSTLYRTRENGLAIGPSLGAASGNGPQYLLGLSFIGTIHHSRLILTIGGESGNVTELNGDHVGQPTNSGTSTVATTSLQRFGGFAMLSWSVFTF